MYGILEGFRRWATCVCNGGWDGSAHGNHYTHSPSNRCRPASSPAAIPPLTGVCVCVCVSRGISGSGGQDVHIDAYFTTLTHTLHMQKKKNTLKLWTFHTKLSSNMFMLQHTEIWPSCFTALSTLVNKVLALFNWPYVFLSIKNCCKQLWQTEEGNMKRWTERKGVNRQYGKIRHTVYGRERKTNEWMDVKTESGVYANN